MDNAGGIIAAIIQFIVIIGIIGFFVTMQWKIFEKAGKEGWLALIPFYNIIVFCEIVGRPAWWIVLAFCAGPIFQIITAMDLAERFGQERNWGIIWLWLLAPIGMYKLAFNEEMQYTAPANPA